MAMHSQLRYAAMAGASRAGNGEARPDSPILRSDSPNTMGTNGDRGMGGFGGKKLRPLSLGRELSVNRWRDELAELRKL